MNKKILVLLCMFTLLSVGVTAISELWEARYDNNGFFDWASSIAVDNAGNVYVIGSSEKVKMGDFDYLTIKYDSNGNKLWETRYDNGGQDDWASSIAVDSAGNVYVTGYSDFVYLTIKYDSKGNKLWETRYDNGNWDVAFGITIDVAGNVYVTGVSDFAYVVIKYDSNGNKLWETRYDSSSFKYAVDIAVDNTGNVYVTGISIDEQGNLDYVTIKYDSNGNKLWETRYDSSSWDVTSSIAVDSAGNVYVTGCSNADYMTIKYDSNGNKLWETRYDKGYAVDIAVDNTGNVYVTGISIDEQGNLDYVTIKYDSNGNKLWETRYDKSREDWASSIAVDNTGNVYVTGYSKNTQSNDDYVTIKYGPSISL